MKEWLAIVLAALLLLSLTACGGSINKQTIVGVWELVDKETETEYGLVWSSPKMESCAMA